jgi:hypothetical protein
VVKNQMLDLGLLIHFTPGPDRDHKDLQCRVIYIINYTVVADANPPSIAPLEFFHVGWPGICFQCGEASQYPIRDVIWQRSSTFRTDLGRMTRYLISTYVRELRDIRPAP